MAVEAIIEPLSKGCLNPNHHGVDRLDISSHKKSHVAGCSSIQSHKVSLLSSPRSAAIKLCIVEEFTEMATHLAHLSKHAERQVRFLVDEEGKILPHVVEYEKEDGIANDLLYWTLKDQLVARHRAKYRGKVIRAKYADEVHALERLFCAGTLDRQMKQRDSDSEFLQAWAGSYARGLEASISSLFRKEKQNATKIFLAYQEYLRRPTTSCSNIEEALRVCSRHMSHRAQEFATKMAFADALALRRETEY